MRTAARVFRSIGFFGLLACLIFAAGSRFRHDSLQGPFILAVFFLACLFLSVLLGGQGAIELDGLVLPGADAHHEEGGEIHLPPPSWMPAAYSVAAAAVVLGLVFSRPVLLGGIAALVLVTIGWGVESVREYRREVAHAAPPVALPPPAAIDLAQRVLAFRRDHGGADSVVQHLGRGGAEIVLVGADGAWGSLVARDAALARTACALAGTTVHDRWPAGLGARVRTGEAQWRAMGGERTFEAPAHRAPRDGTTQIASRVFGSLAIFAIVMDVLYATFSKFQLDNLQGMVVLTALAGAFFYLHLGLKNAKARPEDAAYVVEGGDVTIEPAEPDPPVDLETLHLPPPSWWPAFFSVAGALLVLGLVFSKTLLLVGIGALVLCCVGWGLESVRDYRQQISGQHHGAADALH